MYAVGSSRFLAGPAAHSSRPSKPQSNFSRASTYSRGSVIDCQSDAGREIFLAKLHSSREIRREGMGKARQ